MNSTQSALDGLRNDVDSNTSGIAIAAAIANANVSLSGAKSFGFGIGFGTFNSQQAIGMKSVFRLTDSNDSGARILLNSSAGLGLNRSTFSAGFGLSFEF